MGFILQIAAILIVAWVSYQAGKTYVKTVMNNAIIHKRLEATSIQATSQHLMALDNLQQRLKDA